MYNYTTYTYECSACSTSNCRNCVPSSNVCLECREGFVTNREYDYYTSSENNTFCLKCSIYCNNCYRNNITECFNCSKGTELVNGKC